MDVSIIEKQEQLLQFDRFTNDIAVEIGMMMLEQARAEGLPVAIAISKNGQRVFQAALEGTAPDIDVWLNKKLNTVNRFYCSTLKLFARFGDRSALQKLFGLDPQEYVASGGGFPITVKSAGVVGAIAVSGTGYMEEHNLITSCLARYLKVGGLPVVTE